AEPSPKQLHELSELIRQKGITTIFYEPLASRDPAASLARETSTDLAVLDPIEGKPRNGAADYFGLMQANLSALRKANQCQ
ncbi:MAG TPA: zinc ABC transporter substrate-binding protein, partial [Marmoricola sp.]|nr:zinc ABC transporter substrate-binding protein [Marmoricola sp.]